MGAGKGKTRRTRASTKHIVDDTQVSCERSRKLITVKTNDLLAYSDSAGPKKLSYLWDGLRQSASIEGRTLVLRDGAFNNEASRSALANINLGGCIVDCVSFGGVDLEDEMAFDGKTRFEGCNFDDCVTPITPAPEERALLLHAVDSNFCDCDLANTKLLLSLQNTLLKDCDLSDSVVLPGSKLDKCELVSTNLRFAQIINTRIIGGTSFERCNLKKASILRQLGKAYEHGSLNDVRFSHCDCSEMELENIDLDVVSMDDCSCSRNRWSSLGIDKSDFEHINFQDSVFSHVAVDKHTRVSSSVIVGSEFPVSDAWGRLLRATQSSAGAEKVIKASGLGKVDF